MAGRVHLPRRRAQRHRAAYPRHELLPDLQPAAPRLSAPRRAHAGLRAVPRPRRVRAGGDLEGGGRAERRPLPGLRGPRVRGGAPPPAPTARRHWPAAGLFAVLPPFPGYLFVAYPELVVSFVFLAGLAVLVHARGLAGAAGAGVVFALGALFRETLLLALPLYLVRLRRACAGAPSPPRRRRRSSWCDAVRARARPSIPMPSTRASWRRRAVPSTRWPREQGRAGERHANLAATAEVEPRHPRGGRRPHHDPAGGSGGRPPPRPPRERGPAPGHGHDGLAPP